MDGASLEVALVGVAAGVAVALVAVPRSGSDGGGVFVCGGALPGAGLAGVTAPDWSYPRSPVR